ncbi:nucleoid maintenance ATPase YjeE [Dethiosulfatarculus sandiegensis]|uniref:tRNA threonylcarbamoyladenosine biosynthesis protein TsaE n=1 Tax=Dethiosulfatarculus sandiegensis TaxID=1429043 RepID=A0A0D2IYJ2_9BACT|nr:nucleoid maintenance ATPase YjeE [Dethiosulfatarculus sandiegensis]
MEYELTSEEKTMRLGSALGALLKPGDIVLLKGELGAGKTVFARGLAKGLGVSMDYDVVSPTFTLLNIYPGKCSFFHADLYRLSQGEVLDLELLDEAHEGVLAVEWPERAGDIWPVGSLLIQFASPDQLRRLVRISGPEAILKNFQEHETPGQDD